MSVFLGFVTLCYVFYNIFDMSHMHKPSHSKRAWLLELPAGEV